MKHTITLLIALLLAPLHAADSQPAKPAAKPNIIFIMADDLGWTDTATYGSKYYETPYIDHLAKQGMKLQNHHHCQNCALTRAALMSGQYGARTGVYTVGGISRFDWSPRPLRPVDNVTELPLDRDIIARQLKAGGYATGMFGKWDIGETKNLALSMPDEPRELHARLVAWRKEINAPMQPKNNGTPEPERAKKKGAGKGKKAAKMTGLLKKEMANHADTFAPTVAKPNPADGSPPADSTTTKTPKPSPPPAYVASVPKPTVSEVRYGPHPRNVLDFWRAYSDKPTPLAFVIHGGAWKSGTKERVDRAVDVPALLKAGISVASINYRYTTQAADLKPPVKAPMDDCARALQFVRSKAAEWNLDRERVGAAGSSAGACSSLWLAFHDDLADPKSQDPIARESTRLRCAAVTGAQTSLDPQQMKEWTPNSTYGGHAFGYASFAEFLAGREKIQPWIAGYSPYALVTADDPSVYLIYTAPPALGQKQKDPTHSSNFGVKLQEHCATIKVPCQLVYPGAPNVKHPTPTAFLIEMLKAK